MNHTCIDHIMQNNQVLGSGRHITMVVGVSFVVHRDSKERYSSGSSPFSRLRILVILLMYTKTP